MRLERFSICTRCKPDTGLHLVQLLTSRGCARERPPPRLERAVVAASTCACSCLARTCEDACVQAGVNEEQQGYATVAGVPVDLHSVRPPALYVCEHSVRPPALPPLSACWASQGGNVPGPASPRARRGRIFSSLVSVSRLGGEEALAQARSAPAIYYEGQDWRGWRGR